MHILKDRSDLLFLQTGTFNPNFITLETKGRCQLRFQICDWKMWNCNTVKYSLSCSHLSNPGIMQWKVVPVSFLLYTYTIMATQQTNYSSLWSSSSISSRTVLQIYSFINMQICIVIDRVQQSIITKLGVKLEGDVQQKMSILFFFFYHLNLVLANSHHQGYHLLHLRHVKPNLFKLRGAVHHLLHTWSSETPSETHDLWMTGRTLFCYLGDNVKLLKSSTDVTME